MTTTEYRCGAGHESASPVPPLSCPHMVAGKPCPEPVKAARWGSRKANA